MMISTCLFQQLMPISILHGKYFYSNGNYCSLWIIPSESCRYFYSSGFNLVSVRPLKYLNRHCVAIFQQMPFSSFIKSNEMTHLSILERTGSEPHVINPWWTQSRLTFSAVQPRCLSFCLCLLSLSTFNPLPTPYPIQISSTNAS